MSTACDDILQPLFGDLDRIMATKRPSAIWDCEPCLRRARPVLARFVNRELAAVCADLTRVLPSMTPLFRTENFSLSLVTIGDPDLLSSSALRSNPEHVLLHVLGPTSLSFELLENSSVQDHDVFVKASRLDSLGFSTLSPAKRFV